MNETRDRLAALVAQLRLADQDWAATELESIVTGKDSLPDGKPAPLCAENWEAELRAAGWVQLHLHVWRSPRGAIYRGPYGAWKAMTGQI